MIASLCGSDLLSSYLLCCTIVIHVRRRRVGRDGLGILLARWRLRVVWRSIRMRWTHGMTISVGHAAVRPVLRVHRPRRVMPAMLHGRLRLGLRLDVDADAEAGGAGTVRLLGRC